MAVTFTADDVLRFLDQCRVENPCWSFIDLEHPYTHTANSRLTLYADVERWALVFEKSGFNFRAGRFSLEVSYYGNCLWNLPRNGNPPPHDYTYNVQFVTLIDWAPLQQYLHRCGNPAEPMLDVLLRDRPVSVPGSKQGLRKWIPDIETRNFPTDISGQDLGRYVAYEYVDLCRCTAAEKRAHLPPDLPEIMMLDEWHHRSYFASRNYAPFGEAPRTYETYRLVADVLVSRDPSRYRPTLAPNNHWRNWPNAGML